MSARSPLFGYAHGPQTNALLALGQAQRIASASLGDETAADRPSFDGSHHSGMVIAPLYRARARGGLWCRDDDLSPLSLARAAQKES